MMFSDSRCCHAVTTLQVRDGQPSLRVDLEDARLYGLEYLSPSRSRIDGNSGEGTGESRAALGAAPRLWHHQEPSAGALHR